MINKRILFLAVAALLVIISACSNDSGTGIENRDPILVVNNENLILTGSPRYDIIEISNGGGGQLKWNVVQWPDWMDLSTFAGRVDRDTLDLKLTTNFGKLQYGSYEGSIIITSNGGDATIA
ncbi:MAG: hypothetical protein EHM72_09840, partial [Calditrichaeota bacterium]